MDGKPLPFLAKTITPFPHYHRRCKHSRASDPCLREQVCEHHKRGFDPALLSETFGYQTLGNGLVAGTHTYTHTDYI